ncbi:polyprenyl diphosphate synthase [Laribacter hongkongensis]|uniref:polyprenyl diphosphate synthase n=1 Tax=Laribacter hongkongensis TaxID=168471 RepID=UPI001EFCEAB6|nr:polyprenyl diphosphate synthase [Laribacter hongkongensis]MCG9094058.1 di-trans,poly-cis-decaprenylcistransferase [Laribacter hongkongensis]
MSSSTLAIPAVGNVPRHIAIIMDGNGRWAKKRFLPRVAGHKRGLETVRETVRTCTELGVEYLTLFAFSSENWRRPDEEVSFLMGLFMQALEREVDRLHGRNIRLKIVGHLARFSDELQARIEAAQLKTAGNTGLTLTICADYGGRWDILQAIEQWRQAGGAASPEPVTEADLAPYLSLAYAPEPDLFIRTGGEQRVSNFLLWQLAYTELYFTDVLWPDFDRTAFMTAIDSYHRRERRFGRTSEQLPPAQQRT